MDITPARHGEPVRERLLDAAYKLFARQGIHRVGVDSIVSESGCAKASLYNNFVSKENLALAFLAKREEAWTREWLENSVRKLSADPRERLLGIFDIFDTWFREDGFEGCSFVNVLLESDRGSAVREAASAHLANIRRIVQGLAGDLGLADTAEFAQCWHMLMKGSIVSAGEGNAEAARHAQRAARLVLDGWPRL